MGNQEYQASFFEEAPVRCWLTYVLHSGGQTIKGSNRETGVV